MKTWIQWTAASILVATGAFAQDPSSGYQDKLNAIQQLVDVGFTVNMPFPQKAQGVDILFNLTQDCSLTSAFSRTGLIQSVTITNVNYSGVPSADLRGHNLVLSYDGSNVDAFRKMLPTFQGELDLIASLEAQLKQTCPNLKIDRKADSIGFGYGTNSDYLDDLRALQAQFESPSFSRALASFYSVQVEDTGDILNRTAVQQSPIDVYEDGKFVRHQMISIRMKHDEFQGGVDLMSASLLGKLIDVVAVKGFAEMTYLDIDKNAQLDDVMTALEQLLTPDRVAVLKTHGITKFNFSTRLDTEQNWVNGSELTLGLTFDDMKRVYDTVF